MKALRKQPSSNTFISFLQSLNLIEFCFHNELVTETKFVFGHFFTHFLSGPCT